MLVYTTGLIVSILLGWCAKHTKTYHRGNRLPAVFLSAIPLFLIAALRYDVGTDYMYTYVPYFRYLRWGKNLRSMEPLYKLINQIVIWLGGSYQWVFVICAAIFCVLVFLHIYRDSPDPLLSIFLLCGLTYYFVSLNATRQMVGCAILLYALRFVEEKRWKPFFLAVVIASGFHISCALFAVVFFADKLNIKPIHALALSVILFVLAGPVVRLALTIIRSTPYGKYIGSSFDTDTGGRIILAIQIVILTLLVWQYQDAPKYQLYFKLHMVNTWLAAFAGQIVLIERIRWIFGLATIVSIPMALKNIRDPRIRLFVRLAIIGCFTAYMFIVIGVRNGHDVLPYQTIFGR